MKIVDLLRKDQDHPGITYSLEYFPPKTPKGIQNLKDRITRVHQNHDPLFIDITWRAGPTSEISLDLAKFWTQEENLDVNLHLTCVNMTKSELDRAIEESHISNIKNLVPLRGDLAEDYHDEENRDPEKPNSDFTCALDLINYIKTKYGNDFCLSVSGYPEGHPDQFIEVNQDELHLLTQSEVNRMCIHDGNCYVCPDKSYWDDLKYLKKKIDAGGDIIITQLFFDCKIFLQFVKDCRSIGINCPILPGIMLIQSDVGFKKMTKFCKTRVPPEINIQVDECHGDLSKVRNLGTEIAKEMCRKLYDGGVTHFHLYTLNQETVADSIMLYLENNLKD